MKISRIVTQKSVSDDCEARNWKWVNTNEPYEELANKLATEWNAWFDEVRVAEETFDSDTFKITSKTLKKTVRTYEDKFLGKWIGAKEIVYEEEKE